MGTVCRLLTSQDPERSELQEIVPRTEVNPEELVVSELVVDVTALQGGLCGGLM